MAYSIDMEKSFDSVCIKGLIWKLKYKYNLTNPICILILNYLKNRKLKVQIGRISVEKNIDDGVPQGGILSPKLFNLLIFIADIFHELQTDIKLIQ